MDLDALIAQVDEILIREFELDPASLVATATLREDLDLDSLDALDLVVLLEKELGVKIAERDLMGMSTVGDVHEYIRTRHAAESAVS